MFYPVYMSQQKMFADMDFKILMRDTMLSVYDEPQRLAGGDKLLFPEVKLSVPIVPGEGKIIYNYEMAVESTPQETTPETITFASKSGVDAVAYSNGDFACQKMVVATFGSKSDDWAQGPFVYAGEATLSDGRVMHLYQNKNTSCIRVWQGMNAEQLVRQLKLAQPYQAS
jgi:hypothetical protein